MTLKHQERYCERGEIGGELNGWQAIFLHLKYKDQLSWGVNGKERLHLHYMSLPAATGGAREQTCGACDAVL